MDDPPSGFEWSVQMNIYTKLFIMNPVQLCSEVFMLSRVVLDIMGDRLQKCVI